jgi:hypothetical protein
MKERNSIFLDITSCIPLKIYRLFGETRRLQFQGRRINQARNRTTFFMQIPFLAYSSTLKMEATYSIETTVHFSFV